MGNRLRAILNCKFSHLGGQLLYRQRSPHESCLTPGSPLEHVARQGGRQSSCFCSVRLAAAWTLTCLTVLELEILQCLETDRGQNPYLLTGSAILPLPC